MRQGRMEVQEARLKALSLGFLRFFLVEAGGGGVVRGTLRLGLRIDAGSGLKVLGGRFGLAVPALSCPLEAQ